MVSYLKQVMESMPYIEKFELKQISRTKNVNSDVRLKLSNYIDSELLKILPIEL